MTLYLKEMLRGAVAGLAGLALILVTTLSPSSAIAQSGGVQLIRDAEIEGLMRLYTYPLFKAAGIRARSVDVHLVNHRSVNAFVAGGQRIFIHTGLLLDAQTPNEVIGVLAHETAHIAGGHLARRGIQVDRLTTANIVGMLVGAAAAVGGAMAGGSGGAQTGTAIITMVPTITQRTMLNYARAQESSSDQAAVGYLNKTGQSSRGMLELFYKIANRSVGTLQNVDPYALSHPLPLDRIRNLERIAKASPHFNKKDKPALMLRHRLMQGKLVGFLNDPQTVYRLYPSSNRSLEAQYARAISTFRSGNIRSAIPMIDGLIKKMPKFPYFWELKGQALIENGQAGRAIKPLQRAVKLLPNNGLLNIMLGQAYLGAGQPKSAIKVLKRARRTENDVIRLHLLLAQSYAKLNMISMANLESAEVAIRQGKKKLAQQMIKRAIQGLKRGSPEWIRANDILNFSRHKS